MIFWRDAWLRRAEENSVRAKIDPLSVERLRRHLTTKTSPTNYFCQASEILNATYPLTSLRQKAAVYPSGLRAGNFGLVQLVKMLAVSIFWKARGKLLGIHARGNGKHVQDQSASLRAGDWVEVKSLESVRETLNEQGKNRGLYFSPDMRALCGQRLRVQRRLDKIIVDGTGEMRLLRNTVALENSTCGCAHIGLLFGGCTRCELTYWRESWLRRLE